MNQHMAPDIVTILVIFMLLRKGDFTSLRHGFLYTKLGITVALTLGLGFIQYCLYSLLLFTENFDKGIEISSHLQLQ